MHQVGLAEADAAIEEQRVERDARRLGDAARRGVGELVRLADDETLEGEAAVERRAQRVGVVAQHRVVGGAAAVVAGNRRQRRRHRGAGLERHRPVALHDDVDALNLGVFAPPQRPQAIGVMGDHPVAQKPCRHRHGHHAVALAAHTHRFQPASIGGFADLGAQQSADLLPLPVQRIETLVAHRFPSPVRLPYQFRSTGCPPRTDDPAIDSPVVIRSNAERCRQRLLLVSVATGQRLAGLQPQGRRRRLGDTYANAQR